MIVGERGEIVDDEGEGADIEHLLDQAAQHIGLALHRPEQAGNGDVDRDQDRGQRRDIAVQKPEPAIDVADEGLQELVDDVEIVHDRTALIAAYRRCRCP